MSRSIFLSCAWSKVRLGYKTSRVVMPGGFAIPRMTLVGDGRGGGSLYFGLGYSRFMLLALVSMAFGLRMLFVRFGHISLHGSGIAGGLKLGRFGSLRCLHLLLASDLNRSCHLGSRAARRCATLSKGSRSKTSGNGQSNEDFGYLHFESPG